MGFPIKIETGLDNFHENGFIYHPYPQPRKTGITWSPSEGPASPPPGLIKAFIKLPGVIFFFLQFHKETTLITLPWQHKTNHRSQSTKIKKNNYLFSSSVGGFFFGSNSCAPFSFAAIVTDPLLLLDGSRDSPILYCWLND